jgi:uncharacterized protein involved in exopolysaccharide biosynthesis
MAVHLKLSSDEIAPLRAHYQGIAHDVFAILWRYRALIVLFIVGGFASSIVAIITLPPRYTSEAILQVDFSRDEPNTATKTQRIASMEAAAVVESTLRILRSRTLASAVVSRLGLADDRDFSSSSRLMHAVWSARHALGLAGVTPTAHDIATEKLANALHANIVPRSYVISIAISAGDPNRAAQLVNAVVLEYLRSQHIQQLATAQRNLERDIAEMSAVYGVRHPRTLDVQQKLENLQTRIAGWRRANAPAEAALEAGEFVLAEAVMMPSGPSVPLIFAFVLALSLLACGGLIVFLELSGPRTYRFGLVARSVWATIQARRS